MSFLAPSTPSAPAPPPPPPVPATAANAATQQAGAQEQARLAAATGAGFNQTIASSPEGVPQGAQTAQKQLLGA